MEAEVGQTVDKVIDRKIQEKLGMYDNSKPRSHNLIRDLIQEELEKRPKTKHEVKKAINSTPDTAERHLQHLQEIGEVTTMQVDGTKYWRGVDK